MHNEEIVMDLVMKHCFFFQLLQLQILYLLKDKFVQEQNKSSTTIWSNMFLQIPGTHILESYLWYQFIFELNIWKCLANVI